VEIVSQMMTVAHVIPAHKSGSTTGSPQKPLINNLSISNSIKQTEARFGG
jgi:hypothetical protein